MSNNLKQLREEKGFSQKELAELLGISVFHLNKIENESRTGRNLTVKLAIKAAEILKVSLDQIFLQ